MSFMRLLAAGQSVMGIKKEPGPYKMNQDHLLPKFAPVEKPVIPDLTDEGTAALRAGGHGAEKLRPAQRSPEKVRASRGWMARLGGRFARLIRREQAPAARAGRRAVQTELSLDAVRVVRNDLRDCDYEVVSGRHTGLGKRGTGQQLGVVWNRLTARLLRQAVQDFNLVQKQRGKLLSQASDGGGGAGGA